MKLKRHAVKGLTVFQNKAEIDFSAIPSGLIAITGPNGSGKTSLVESIFGALYRELPSRGPMIKWCSGKDASVVTEYEMDGVTYKSQVLMDAVAGRQEAFLESGGMSVPGCNGKLTPYDAEIEKRIGSRRLLLSSIFSAQNRRGSFADMDVSDRKVLFTELLGIGQYPVLLQKAGKAHLDISLAIAHLSSKREALEQEMNLLGGMRNRLAAVKLAGREAQDASAAIEDEVAKLREQHRRASDELVELTTRIQHLKSALADKERQYAADKLKAEAAIGQRFKHLQTMDAQNAIDSSVLDVKIKDVTLRKENNQKLVDRKDAILEAETRLTAALNLMHSLEFDWAAAVLYESTAARYNSDISSAKAALAMTEQTIQHWTDSVHDLKNVPCEGKGPYAGCAKITTAVEHKNALPEMIDKANQQRDNITLLESRVVRRTCDETAADLQKDRDSLAAKIKALHEEAKYADSVRTAADRIKELEDTLEEYRRQKAMLATAADSSKDPLMISLREGLSTLVGESKWLLGSQMQIHGHETAALQAKDAIAAAQSRLAEAVTKQTLLMNQVARLESEAASIQSDVDRIAAKQPEFEALQAQDSALRRDLAEWAILGAALGPKGIPALEIDAAGPSVSALVNDLLAACFSNRFTMDLKTQRLAADGSRMIEDFGIRIIDSVKGRDGTIDDLSGGEKAIVGEALGIGIAIYNKSSHRFETIVRDEVVGCLDAENSVKYVQLVRKAMKMGGFHHALLVVHNQEVAELCDARISCHDGTLEIA